MVIRETLSHHFIFIYNFYIHNILSRSESFFKKKLLLYFQYFLLCAFEDAKGWYDSIIQQKKACVIIKKFCHRTLRQPCSYYFIAPDILLRKILHYHIRYKKLDNIIIQLYHQMHKAENIKSATISQRAKNGRIVHYFSGYKLYHWYIISAHSRILKKSGWF